jgi:hypothetical protein
MKRKFNLKKYQTGTAGTSGYSLNYLDTNPEMITPRGMNNNGSIQQIQNPIPNQIPQYQGNNQQQGFNPNTLNNAGKFAGMAGSMYYGSQQPSSLASAKGEQGYNTVMGGVSKAGPIGGVIGGISAIGDAIGKPIREHAERVNTNTGGYQDISGARQTAIIGGLFNPLKAAMEHPNYKKLDQKMKYAKQTRDWNTSLQNSSLMRQNNPQYNYNPTFAGGGYYADGGYGANAELEDNEIFRTPEGDMDKVNGRTHAEGGEQMNLPQNTEILGKNIAPNGKSYKANGDKLFRQFNKYTKILEDKPTTLAKNTAKMMLDKVHKNYTALMNTQEREKQMQQMNQMYAYGGLTMYQTGGNVNVPANYVTPQDSGRVYNPSQSGSGTMVSTNKRTDSIKGDILNEVNERYNTTKDKTTKDYWKGVREYLAKFPSTKERGLNEYNLYYNSDPRLQHLLSDPLLTGKLKKRGFELPAETTNPTGTFAYGGLIRYDAGGTYRNDYGKYVDKGIDTPRLDNPYNGPLYGNTESDLYGESNGLGNYVDFQDEYKLQSNPNEPNIHQPNIPDEYYNKIEYQKKLQNELQDDITIPTHRSGGIHINPANKGKFNALKARTGKSTAQLTHSSNPLTRKRAIFAQNARKWRHEDGGMINNTGYLKGTETDNNPMNIIPSNYITTNGMSRPITAMSDTGDTRKLYPNTGNYAFGGNYVMEQPMYQNGGNTGDIYSSESDVNLNKQPGYRGFVSPQDASTARTFFGSDTPDVMETRLGAPGSLQGKGVNMNYGYPQYPNGYPDIMGGRRNQEQLQARNQYYGPGQEHTRFIDETPDAWYNKAFDTAGQYGISAYNMYQGMFGKPEHVNSVYNPYESQVMGLMKGRRYNIDPELEANRNATANYYQNLRQGAPSQGRYLSGLQAGQSGRQRADAEAIARKQNIDNQYLGEEASTLGGFGQQRANMDFQVNEMNAQNRAAQRKYLPTALAELQQQTQMNKIMREKKRLSMNKALSDEERQRLYMEAFKGYDFANRMNPITGEAVN